MKLCVGRPRDHVAMEKIGSIDMEEYRTLLLLQGEWENIGS
jgi:hypothetical protein